jgi:hypothetical protein
MELEVELLLVAEVKQQTVIQPQAVDDGEVMVTLV